MATIFLATVIGWYMVLFGFLVLARTDYVKFAVAEILEQRGLFFLLAVITMILGLLMVASHNSWVMGWPVAVTVICWLVFISGVLRLFLPDVHEMGKWFLHDPIRLKITAVVFLIYGGYLLFHVYFN